MRDALNNNPLVQAAVVGLLLVAVAVFVISSSGGGEESGESSGGTSTTTSTSATASSASESAPSPGSTASPDAALAALGQSAAAHRPLPHRVLRAYEENKTVVLLFVHDGGIDDRLTKLAARGLAGFGDVALFVVPAHEISNYAAITEGVGVERVPALVVVTPKHLRQPVPTASVSYGFQSAESVRQAVIDAGYKGPTVEYHP